MLVCMSDANSRGVYFNTQWRSFTGRSLEELLGESWLNDVHPEDREFCLAAFERAFEAREKFSLECRLRRHDGEYRYILHAGTPEFAEDGTVVGYINSAIDVTSQKMAV